jgi:glycine cleavage system H protein
MVALFVAFMFVSLVLTDLAIEKWKVWRAAHPARATSRTADVMGYGFEGLCELPEGVHLSSAHTWFKPESTGGMGIGADALIAHAVGAATRIILPQVGDLVTAGRPLFRLEREGRTITIPSAITGRVMSVNSRLADEPALLSSDPYGSGWICHLSPTRMEASAPSMRFGERATLWLASEFTRLQEFVFAQVPPDLALGATSQDGGIPATGCLAELGPTAWSAFETNFLRQA